MIIPRWVRNFITIALAIGLVFFLCNTLHITMPTEGPWNDEELRRGLWAIFALGCFTGIIPAIVVTIIVVIFKSIWDMTKEKGDG